MDQMTVWGKTRFVLLAVMLGGCAIPAGSFRDAETSGQQVGDDGNLYYPYVGLVKATGMNIAELRTGLVQTNACLLLTDSVLIKRCLGRNAR